MKIVQVATSDMGGAGIAAKQLHKALLTKGKDSTFVTKVKLGEDTPAHVATGDSSEGTDLRNYYLKGRKPGFEYFSFPFSSLRSGSVDAINSADIVHLHWVSDSFIDPKDVFSLKNKKFVWTLHDMNPFTGGCHHSDGCLKFQTHCNYCPQLEGTVDEYMSHKILDHKFEALKQISSDSLKIVTPSQWLGNLSKQSKLLGRFEHSVIPNLVQVDSKELDRIESRRKMEIEDGQTVLLFVAHGVSNPRKGLRTLLEALRNIDKKENLKLITIGGDPISVDGINCFNFGFINDPGKIAEIFLVADAFMLPSLAENFPNTIVESLLCGTPVIASAVGGINEQISNDNGILVESNKAEDWVEAINVFLNVKDKFRRESIKKDAEKRYTCEKIIADHINLYESFIR